jgi:hypothetical protein
MSQSGLVLFPAVSPTAYDLAATDDDTAHRHFALSSRLPGKDQRLLHIIPIVHHGSLPLEVSYPKEAPSSRHILPRLLRKRKGNRGGKSFLMMVLLGIAA